MTKQEALTIKNLISNGYWDRKDYPPYAVTPWDDRTRFKEYVFKIIDECVSEVESEVK